MFASFGGAAMTRVPTVSATSASPRMSKIDGADEAVAEPGRAAGVSSIRVPPGTDGLRTVSAQVHADPSNRRALTMPSVPRKATTAVGLSAVQVGSEAAGPLQGSRRAVHVPPRKL